MSCLPSVVTHLTHAFQLMYTMPSRHNAASHPDGAVQEPPSHSHTQWGVAFTPFPPLNHCCTAFDITADLNHTFDMHLARSSRSQHSSHCSASTWYRRLHSGQTAEPEAATHLLRHSTCTWLIVPLHAQGEHMSGPAPGCRQNLQSCPAASCSCWAADIAAAVPQTGELGLAISSGSAMSSVSLTASSASMMPSCLAT